MVLRGIHYFGAILFLAASILLIVASISAPAINHLSLLTVDLSNAATNGFSGLTGTRFNMGSFGWCMIDGNGNSDVCSESMIGYDPFGPLGIVGGDFSAHTRNTVRILTKVFVLHPIGAGLCFITMALGFIPGLFGGLLATMFGLLALLCTIVSVICDFVMLALLRKAINNQTTIDDNIARYGESLWCVLAATALAAVGTLILLATCCVGRRHSNTKEV